MAAATEETPVVCAVEAPPVPEKVEEAPPVPEKVEAAGEGKKAEEGEAKKASRKRTRKPRSAGPHHPPYFEMIKEAIMALDGNGKSGASPYAIAKHMGEKHKEDLPANYRKVLAVQLRNFAAKGRLVKVKASFKLAAAEEKAAAAAAAAASKVRRRRSAKKPSASKEAKKAVAPARPARAKRARKAAPAPAKPKQPRSVRTAVHANKASA